jgi:hypothetical protein
MKVGGSRRFGRLGQFLAQLNKVENRGLQARFGKQIEAIKIIR